MHCFLIVLTIAVKLLFFFSVFSIEPPVWGEGASEVPWTECIHQAHRRLQQEAIQPANQGKATTLICHCWYVSSFHIPYYCEKYRELHAKYWFKEKIFVNTSVVGEKQISQTEYYLESTGVASRFTLKGGGGGSHCLWQWLAPLTHCV